MQEVNKIFCNSTDGKKYIACLLYSGVAKYNDKNWSMVLINKHIDAIAKTFVGSPVVEGHNQPIGDSDPRILGIVDKVFCNSDGFTIKDGTFIEPDAKYYCEFSPVSGKETECEEAVKRNGFVSTSYLADEVIQPKNGEKFEYINLPYDVEIKSVKARHIALVSVPRYEDAVIYNNEKENNMDIESKIEIEKGVFVSFFSSTAEKGKELLSNIFNNSKKKDNNISHEEAKEKLEELEKHEEESIKEKDNSKKKNNSEEEKENEDDDKEKENSEDEKLDNSVDIDGEKVSMEDLKECYRNYKKSNEKFNNSKEEKISLSEIEAKTFNNNSTPKKFKIGISEFGYNNFFNNSKK